MSKVPFVRDSQTSKAAADAIEPSLPWREYAVLRFITERGHEGATDDELTVHFTAVPHNWAEPTARVRRISLAKKCLIERPFGEYGKQHLRKTRKGRDATVWVARTRDTLFD